MVHPDWYFGEDVTCFSIKTVRLRMSCLCVDTALPRLITTMNVFLHK